MKWPLWEEFRNQRASEDWILREGSREELVLEVSWSLQQGQNLLRQWKPVECPQGGEGSTAGKPPLQ